MGGLRGRSRAAGSRTCTPAFIAERIGRSRPAGRTYRRRTGGKGRWRSPRWKTRSSRARSSMVLNAIYEEDFLGFSYGFRPGRGPHDALDALAVGIDQPEGELDTGRRHPVVLRLGQPGMARPLRGTPDRRQAHHPPDPKWLKAGVLEDGTVTVSDRGTGQGSVISPLLANIYLHYVLDLWAERWRRREAKGDMIIVRYADDLVAGFEHEDDARRFLDAMRARFEEFALSLHPDKTRLIEFGRLAAARPREARARQTGNLQLPRLHLHLRQITRGQVPVKRKSRRDRVRAKLKEIKEELRRRMHRPIPRAREMAEAGRHAASQLPRRARPTCRPLAAFRHHVIDLWRRTLRRRSQKDRTTWDADDEAGQRLAPQTAYPPSLADQRFAVKHPRWEPYAGKPHVRFCAGGAQQ